jgi:hypothetical protein
MRKRRRIPATELRVHLGEALKALQTEELVIEKGGVPVAVVRLYEGPSEEVSEMRTEYEKSLSKSAEPNGMAKTFAAIERGWVGIEANEFIANVERWREAGATRRRFSLDDDDAEDTDEGDDDGEAPAGQQYLYRFAPSETTQRVADGDGTPYRAGGPGD